MGARKKAVHPDGLRQRRMQPPLEGRPPLRHTMHEPRIPKRHYPERTGLTASASVPAVPGGGAAGSRCPGRADPVVTEAPPAPSSVPAAISRHPVTDPPASGPASAAPAARPAIFRLAAVV